MREEADSHRREWKGCRGVGGADGHFRGRNDGMWARSRVTVRCSSFRQAPKKNHKMWRENDEFCLDMVVWGVCGNFKAVGQTVSLRIKGKFWGRDLDFGVLGQSWPLSGSPLPETPW